ncbi:MAG: non-ribosomal peptide synthetase [Mycobacterium sp.]|nr:non-ribosomal peptide synthetase [Mycobacterium sp.]
MGDGRSFIVLREWFMFYDAARRGEVLSLPPARPFRDYIVWRRSLDSAAAEEFWRTTLGSFDASTSFGIEVPNRPAPDERFGDAEQRLSQAVSGRLREAAGRAGVTVNTMVQAAWAVLLHRYSGESDIVFGATRPPEHQRAESGSPYLGPRNPAEETIANIWKAVLRVDRVGLDDHFFELGGDSFLSIRVHAQLTNRLRADLPIVALLQYPTVRTLARHLTSQNKIATTATATMDRARKQREALAHQRNLTGKR